MNSNFFHSVLFHDIIWEEKPEFLDKEFNTLKIENISSLLLQYMQKMMRKRR